MKTLNLGQLQNILKVIAVAATETRGFASKTIQAEFNDGMNVLLELATREIQKSEHSDMITQIQLENLEWELDQIEARLK